MKAGRQSARQAGGWAGRQAGRCGATYLTCAISVKMGTAHAQSRYALWSSVSDFEAVIEREQVPSVVWSLPNAKP